nr:uncharacterized protein LOC126529409 [Dermacentor andersoni]
MTTGRSDSLNLCDVGLADIEGIKGFFSGHAVDHASPCTATEDRACHIVRHLTVWNEVLSQAKLELRETPRTRSGLTVASIDCPYIKNHSLDTLHRVAKLLHCLVKKHHCMTHVDVTMGRLNVYDELLCDALRGNQFIESLKLRDSFSRGLGPHRRSPDFREALVSEECGESVANIFARNTTLRSIHITASRQRGAFIWDVWLTSITENETLQELTLPFNIWRPQAWALFFRALSTKHSLKHVIIDGVATNAFALQQVCEALRESGADEKVVFGPELGACCYRHDLHLLRYHCFRDVIASQADDGADAPPLGRLLHQLCSLNHVTSLTVTIDPGTYREDLSSALADYVGTTTTLKKLRLISVSVADPANETDLAWAAVVESFSRNSSLAELFVSATCMPEDDSERMADFVKRSENIRRFSVSVQNSWHSAWFVSRLSDGIFRNYSLLKLEFPGYMNKDSFAIWDTARRNSRLVASASQFLAGANPDKTTAAALERVLRHRALLAELAEVQSISEGEAAAALRDEVRSFEGMHEFMRLAGVVKERVTCHRREDGCVQLDDLNEYCWIAIRRCLALDDVVDECSQSEPNRL